MTAYTMVPVEATPAMIEADIDSAQATTKAAMLGNPVPFVDGLRRCYSAMIAAAPPFVVTDAMERAAANAMFCHRETPVTLGEMMRAAIEAALAEAAKGDV
jgi:hypothetical protein